MTFVLTLVMSDNETDLLITILIVILVIFPMFIFTCPSLTNNFCIVSDLLSLLINCYLGYLPNVCIYLFKVYKLFCDR
jgi:hypothetical protein